MVAREIGVELEAARSALESFAENPEDLAALRRLCDHIHLAQGALRLAEVYGGALLAEEMEHVARHVETTTVDGKSDADALDALLRAMEQLPSYVDRVASGGRDMPLALLPLLNDMRAVRGSALLSEGALLMLNLESGEAARAVPHPEADTDIRALAQHSRPRFQRALLGWIRDDKIDENLAILSGIAVEIEGAATTQPVFQLWWVVAAVLEALQHDGLPAGVSIKCLLGQVDRELRRLQEGGEQAYDGKPPVELLNNLLFYVARATSSGVRVVGVRESFRLDEMLPVDDEIDDAKETLSAPSVRLMKTVAAAIRDDLTRVKDVLDIFVRKGAAQVAELAPQLDLLRKISDTLGVLGLGALRDRVQGEIESLNLIVRSDEPPDDATLLGIAAALIEVEDSLDSQLVRMILPEAEQAASGLAEPTDEEFRQVQEAVLRECLVNMARIKEAVTHVLGAPLEAQGLDQVPQLVRGITAGLLMLGRERAVAVMERVGHALADIVRPDAEALEAARLDLLAEAIVAVEYFMEMVQAGRPEPGHMLDTAEACLDSLVPSKEKIVTLHEPGEAEPAKPRPEPVAAEPAASAGQVSPIDPEFVELFVEEARENISRLHEVFPLWESNPQDVDALLEIRRIFHTLKGSGRMVGALRVGELSWSLESLLNRVISQTLPRSSEIVSVARDAVAAVPLLVDELEQGAEAGVDVAAIIARADAVSGRETPELPPTSPEPEIVETPVLEPVVVEADEAVAEAIEDAVPTMDPVLHDIYRKETAGHIAIVRDFAERSSRGVAPYPITDALYRACHTLSGIAKTAAVRQGIKVAEPMERYVRKLYDNGHGLPAEGLTLLSETMTGLETVSDHVDENTGFFPNHDRMVADWHALEKRLDAELATLAEAAERTIAEVWQRPEEFDEAVYDAMEEIVLESPPEESLTEDVEEEAEPESEFGPVVEVVLEEPADSDLAAKREVLSEPVAETTNDAVEQPPAAAEEQPPAPAEVETEHAPEVAQDPDFDADIAAIFSEEASELLEQAQVGLTNWSADRADSDQITELKRLLHTLKGGARMAGLAAMGDLSHELESFLASLESGDLSGDDAVVSLLQASLDELHRMRDTANEGGRIAPADELIGRINSLASGEQEPSEVPTEPPLIAEAAASAEPAPVIVVSPEPETVTEGEPVEPASADLLPAPAVELEAEVAASAEPVMASGLPGREPAAQPDRHELARVDADLLDELLNNAGEVSIFRARVEQQMTSMEFHLAELGRTVTRLREQLRKLDMETEAQILFKHQQDSEGRADFDPLELDRYSTIQQLSRALAESASDVASIEGLLGNLNQETQTLLQQQGRVVAEVQNGLMRTRMVPFDRHVQRLGRIVRQAAQESGKKVDLRIEGASGELDRQVLERMLPPFEHMLRNAVVHGIELPEQRLAAGKPETGRIDVRLEREGAEVIITVSDDGQGLDVVAIRDKARHMGLLPEGQDLTDEQALQLVLEPGFSTAGRLTQQAGRGVGMDVVATEVKKLGGGLFIESTPGHGARFTIRLPFTLAITQALIVRVHNETYALPVATVEGVARVPRDDVLRHLEEDQPSFEYGGETYRFQNLGGFIDSPPAVLSETDEAIPVILVRAGEHSTALVVDELVGSREIVVKSLGPQISGIRGISGATILGDGRIVVILDVGAMVRSEWRSRPSDVSTPSARDDRVFVLVVDDSITVRRVTQRLLERNGMRVITAKDGIEAMSVLQENTPDVILLDIEMPRMDGYEVASQVRNDPRLLEVPIIMITSRVGDKHRARAIELGVDDYLGKPYQESQLLDAIEPLVLARRRLAG